MRTWILLPTFAALCAAAGHAATARDCVELMDGTRMRGTLLAIEDDHVSIRMRIGTSDVTSNVAIARVHAISHDGDRFVVKERPTYGRAKPAAEKKAPTARRVKVPLWSEEAQKWVAGGRNFFVSPEGTPSGNGSRASPWNIESVFSGGAGVRGGDVVWVEGGTYPGCFEVSLKGQAGRPVVIRAVPGERAILDSASHRSEYTLKLNGAHVVIWGLEICSTNPEGYKGRAGGYGFFARESRMINCYVHDVACSGFWQPAVDAEMNGNVLIHIGQDRPGGSRGSGHNMYTQNSKGVKVIKDNIIAFGFSFGIHMYTEGGTIDNYDIVGNTWFGNGLASKRSGHKADCLVGGLKPAHNITLRENMGWSNGMGRCVQLGYSSSGYKGLTLTDNYFAGRVDFNRQWEDVAMKGNTFLGPVKGKIDTTDFPENDYRGDRGRPVVFVRKNDYEPGRANITVFNWPNVATVPVDLPEVVPVGAEYEIRNGQDYGGEPVYTGTYKGGRVALPMHGMGCPQPHGMTDTITERDQTGPQFNVFVVTSWTPGSRKGSTEE